jgi:hypothetical protein
MFGLLVAMQIAGYSDETNIIIMFALWTMPLGLSQYVGSVIDIIAHRRASKHKWHLGLSTFVLLMLLLGNTLGISEFWDAVLYTTPMLGCGALAIYYWTLLFVTERKIVEQNHSVYDL